MDEATLDILISIGIFVSMFGIWWKMNSKVESTRSSLDAKVEVARQASDGSHREILAKLTNIEVTLARLSTGTKWLQTDRASEDD